MRHPCPHCKSSGGKSGSQRTGRADAPVPYRANSRIKLVSKINQAPFKDFGVRWRHPLFTSIPDERVSGGCRVYQDPLRDPMWCLVCRMDANNQARDFRRRAGPRLQCKRPAADAGLVERGSACRRPFGLPDVPARRDARSGRFGTRHCGHPRFIASGDGDGDSCSVASGQACRAEGPCKSQN
jgi:hypothetical protein